MDEGSTFKFSSDTRDFAFPLIPFLIFFMRHTQLSVCYFVVEKPIGRIQLCPGLGFYPETVVQGFAYGIIALCVDRVQERRWALYGGY